MAENILISGAGTGFGLLTARTMLKAGWTVYAGIREPEGRNAKRAASLSTFADGTTGRIIDLLRRAAVDALTQKSKSVGIDHLLVAGANLPAIINQRADFPI